MSEQPDQSDEVAAMLLGGLGQMRAAMEHALAPERFEYARVPWERVNELAREGWQLVPIPAEYGEHGLLMFVMVRKLGPADEAAELLRGEQR